MVTWVYESFLAEYDSQLFITLPSENIIFTSMIKKHQRVCIASWILCALDFEYQHKPYTDCSRLSQLCNLKVFLSSVKTFIYEIQSIFP